MATGLPACDARPSISRAARALRSLLATSAMALLLSACGSDTAKPAPDQQGSAKPSASAAAAAGELAVATLDTSTLTPREKRELTAQLGDILAPCPEVAVSLAQCIAEKRECAACAPAAEYLARQVRAGRPKQDREQAFAARFDSKLLKDVAVGDAPFKGPADAPVTIVEWADFECSACMMWAPVLELIVERFPGQVRVAYKFYPLPSHKNGEYAARAAIAANDQGKFWEMHALLFGNQGRLERRDVEALAKSIELDLTKFKASITADATTAWLERDKKQAEDLGLESTPFMFINGRYLPLEHLTQGWSDLEAWVKLDIELAGQKPNPPSARFLELTEPEKKAAPGAGGSAAPAAGSAGPAAGSAAPAASGAPN